MFRYFLIVTIICGFMKLYAQDSTKVLIVYYSQQGHTEKMAQAVEKGAKSVELTVERGAKSVEFTRVRLLSVQDAKNEDVLWADAIILGSPVYNANVAPPVQTFINRWPFQGAPLKDKIGAAFVTAGGISAGEEFVQLNLLKSMLIFGMIIVGGPNWTQAFGASAVTEEEPFISEKSGEVADRFLIKGENLGRRVAEITSRWNRNRN
ncbi:MAG: flavodoxin family protein [Calditrichia bacterium]